MVENRYRIFSHPTANNHSKSPQTVRTTKNKVSVGGFGTRRLTTVSFSQIYHLRKTSSVKLPKFPSKLTWFKSSCLETPNHQNQLIHQLIVRNAISDQHPGPTKKFCREKPGNPSYQIFLQHRVRVNTEKFVI